MVSHTPHMVQVSWGCTCHDGARRSICCNCHISSHYNRLYLSLHIFVLGIMTMFMFPLCKCTFDVWFSCLSLKKIFSTAIAFTEGILKNNAEHKTSWESPWRGKTRSVFSKKHLFPQTLQGNALSPKCSDLLWVCPTPSVTWTWQHKGHSGASSADEALWC